MWILTRNDSEVLKQDGDWSYSQFCNPDAWRMFEDRNSAVAFAEAEGVQDFTRPLSLHYAVKERVEHEGELERRQTTRLADCEYVALPEPIEFHSTTDEWDIPIYNSFMATHYVMCCGEVCGVVGYASDNESYSPFHSFVGDDYFLGFSNVYRRSNPASESSTSTNQASDGDVVLAGATT